MKTAVREAEGDKEFTCGVLEGGAEREGLASEGVGEDEVEEEGEGVREGDCVGEMVGEAVV